VWTFQTTLISVVVLSLYLMLAMRQELNKINTNVFKKLIYIGFFVGIAYVAGIYGLQLSTSINYSFLIKSTLVFTILLAFFFLKEHMSLSKLTLMAIFIIGAYLISTGGKIIVPRVGDLLTLLAAFCFSAAVVIQKPLTEKINPNVIGWGRVFFALVFVAIVIIALKVDVFKIAALGYVMVAGIMNAVLAVYINKTIAVSSASYLTMMSMTVPVINSLLGVALLNESMSFCR